MSASKAWMERAACTEPGVDPDWFFSPEDDLQELAKRVCMSCHVRNACSSYAKTSNRGAREQFGIWAGKDHEQKRRPSWRTIAERRLIEGAA